MTERDGPPPPPKDAFTVGRQAGTDERWPASDPWSRHGSPSAASAPLAGFWPRVGAYLLDALIVNAAAFGAMFAIGFVFGLAVAFSGGDPEQMSTSQETIFGAITIVISFVLPLGYFIIAEGTWGKTVGKHAAGIRVVDTERHDISYGKAAGRAFGRIISGLPLGLGFLWAAWDDRKQTWHDKMAGTLVIRSR